MCYINVTEEEDVICSHDWVITYFLVFLRIADLFYFCVLIAKYFPHIQRYWNYDKLFPHILVVLNFSRYLLYSSIESYFSQPLIHYFSLTFSLFKDNSLWNMALNPSLETNHRNSLPCPSLNLLFAFWNQGQ